MSFKNMIHDATFQRLRANWDQQQPLKGTEKEIDFIPVCKLFNPCGAATWLITECDENGLAFGLADLGFGSPELGYISLDELAEIKMLGGLVGIEQDVSFVPTQSLSQYAEEARREGRIKA
ncbi:DUF2958 domain-containing protein [Novosphingobium sp. PY1]|uniref:DUF2958 domain-containing protein n=1 Tax=Novosphingobium sp. PY1 TaxID=1882221 RepID=UPI001A8CCCD8|nr:DUF2958 domain-containing protein [Novosphingobium sp. PY1]GFM27153.1 transposon protein [Novosphingobium sp. PY1]